MTSIREDVRRAYILKKILKPTTKREKSADKKTFKEIPLTGGIFYCEQCKGPVVDTWRTRRNHAVQFPACADAMEKEAK